MSFDPNQFLDAQFTESNDTKSLPIPEGEYQALIEKVGIRQGVIKKGDRVGESFLALDVTWDIDDQGVKQAMDRSKVTVTQGIMLDLTEEGNIDFGKGKNVTLGKVREAVGLNVPGQPFAFNMFPGRAAKILVKHRIDGEDIRNDVKGVVKIG